MAVKMEMNIVADIPIISKRSNMQTAKMIEKTHSNLEPKNILPPDKVLTGTRLNSTKIRFNLEKSVYPKSLLINAKTTLNRRPLAAIKAKSQSVTFEKLLLDFEGRGKASKVVIASHFKIPEVANTNNSGRKIHIGNGFLKCLSALNP